jgi:hypothetical protein
MHPRVDPAPFCPSTTGDVGRAQDNGEKSMTKYRLPAVAAAALFTLSIAPFANVASAMPVGNALAIVNAAPLNIDTVQWRGRGWGGGGWGVGAGLIGGMIIGGMLASPYYYGSGPYGAYYGPGPYYAPPVYGGPPPGDAVAYCMQRFRSYDPGSGTYLGFDGLRHPCP